MEGRTSHLNGVGVGVENTMVPVYRGTLKKTDEMTFELAFETACDWLPNYTPFLIINLAGRLLDDCQKSPAKLAKKSFVKSSQSCHRSFKPF